MSEFLRLAITEHLSTCCVWLNSLAILKARRTILANDKKQMNSLLTSENKLLLSNMQLFGMVKKVKKENFTVNFQRMLIETRYKCVGVGEYNGSSLRLPPQFSCEAKTALK